jgi:glucose-1-phosphatase
VIVWDLGGVASHFRPARRLTELAIATGLDEATVHAALWDSGLDAAAELGRLEPDEVWDQVIDGLQGRVDRATLRRCWALAFDPNHAVLDLIDELGEPAALLSNNGPIVTACLGDELSLIGDRFAHLVLSWQLGAAKPSRAAFERAATVLGARPADLTLIDDRPTNVRAARDAGWAAIHFSDCGRLRSELRSRGRIELLGQLGDE